MKLASEIVLTFALNALWQIAVIGMCAALSAWLLRGVVARYRHAVWVAALILSLVLPALSCVRSFSAEKLSRERNEQGLAPKVEASTYPRAVQVIEPVEGDLRQETRNVDQPSARVLHAPIRLNRNLAGALIGLYALLILYRFAGLFRAWLRTKAIVRGAFAFEPSDQCRAVVDECEKAIGRKRARILTSKAVNVPITAGIFKPVIILPGHLLNETDRNLLMSAIGHEFVHVVRRDYLLNLIYELVYLPVSFHSAAAVIRRGIKRTRELCCDERVTDHLINAQSYAQSIVRLIGSAPVGGRLATNTTIGIAESDNLEARIMSLMKDKKSTTRRKLLLLLSAFALLITPCIAAAKLALSFDFAIQEPSETIQKQRKEKRLRSNQEQVQEELKRAANKIREELRLAQETQRPALEQKLREVERALEDQASVIQKLELEKYEAKIRELRQALEQTEKSQPRDQAQIQKMRALIAEIERQRAEQMEQLEKYAQMRAQYSENLENAFRAQWEKEKEEKLKYQELLEKEGRYQELEQLKQSRMWEEQAQEEKYQGAELAKLANISMDRAIQIATSKYPGKVLTCRLGREKEGPVFYHLVIVNTDGDKPLVKHVWVSAIDGTILRTEDEAKKPISGGSINGRAITLPQPKYPEIARAAHASGQVSVEVLIDEQGDVIEAKAISGHPLLQGASVNAAREAKFAPTYMEGQPVRVRGRLTYNFVVQ